MTGDEWISSFAALVVAAGIAFGVLAAFPRSPRGILWATLTNLVAFAIMNLLGSALVGPTTLSGMLLYGPFCVVSAIVWYYWKVKAQPSS